MRAQLESRELWNDARCADDAHFYTLGYSGRSLDSLIEALTGAGVRSLVDIRHNPVSMYRPEMSKGNLADRLREHGIEYRHCPALGVPRDIRARAIDAGTRDVIWDWYEANVIARQLGRNLDRFLNSVEHPAALMCTELDPGECHRHRLFYALEERGLRGFEL